MTPLRAFGLPLVLPIVAAMLALAAPGCAESGSAPRSASNGLPAYLGPLAASFDDVIEPAAVGLALDARSDPRFDPKFRARAQTADMAMRARVQTVTALEQGLSPAYQIGFHMVERLGGRASPGDDFVVRVDKDSPAMGILKSFEGRLVGKSFVLFVKAFSRIDGERELHFHASPDAPETIAAVKEAVILDETK